jgi:SAM-dependent methyltransferase
MTSADRPRPALLTRLLVGARRTINETLDWLRFRIDTFPRSGPLRRLTSAAYQPLPWVGAPGRRADGTETRWQAIAELAALLDVESALDIGCNVGYFTIRLAESGITTIGVERSPNNWRSALYAIRKARMRGASILTLSVEPDTVALLPSADLVLCLAVWHHLVHDHGPVAADAMLAALWARTRRALVFETGETETPGHYGLPAMDPDPQAWIAAHLDRMCPDGEVVHLGRHAAPRPGGGDCTRNLFAVMRRDPASRNGSAGRRRVHEPLDRLQLGL